MREEAWRVRWARGRPDPELGSQVLKLDLRKV